MFDLVRYSGIEWNSSVDGEGFRVVIFFSGCKHHCKGCHNPETHDFNAGRVFDAELKQEIADYIRETPFISGATLSGGDPMYSATEIAPFVRTLKNLCPDKTVWVYSGFTYEEITSDPSMLELLKLCDVLVDGPFILEQRDVTLGFRGSRNQRIIDVQVSLRSGHVVLWEAI